MARSGRGRRQGGKGRGRLSRPVERGPDGSGTTANRGTTDGAGAGELADLDPVGGLGAAPDRDTTVVLGRAGGAADGTDAGAGAGAGEPADLDPVGGLGAAPDTNTTADLGPVGGGVGDEAGSAAGPGAVVGADAGAGPAQGGSGSGGAGLVPTVGAGPPPHAGRAPTDSPAALAPTHTVLLPSAPGDHGPSPRAWRPEPTLCPVCRIPPAPGVTTCPDCREDLAPLLFLRARADRGYNSALAQAVASHHVAARDELRWVLADNARHVPALVLLGKVHARLGAEADARAAWQRALRLAPGHETAAACLAALHDEPASGG